MNQHQYWLGKKRSKETITKIKEKRKLQDQKAGHTPNWKGGKILRSGYWYIRKSRGYIAEHRLIMEKKLGRYLKLEETIHHINGIKTDNRIENLELFISRGKHTKYGHPEIREKQKILFKGKHFSPKTEFKKDSLL